MSVFDVGTENLPNVYIYKMVVSNSRQQPSFGQMAYKISIHCLMKDLRPVQFYMIDYLC